MQFKSLIMNEDRAVWAREETGGYSGKGQWTFGQMEIVQSKQ